MIEYLTIFGLGKRIRKSFLSKFNKKTGWYVNWSRFPEQTEVYALVLAGTVDIQGMIAVQYDGEARAVAILWACVSPENNIWEYGAVPLPPINNPFRIMFSDKATQKIREVTNYKQSSTF